VKAPDLSSSATSPLLELDLLEAGRLAAFPASLLRGADRDLLAPLRFHEPGTPVPAGPAIDRSALAVALGVANEAYGHPRAAALTASLADPATRVVVAGQQPGLWGGPLLALVKALTAVKYAERSVAAGQPAVAVFWMATEDHDWAESARATLLGRNGPERLSLGDDFEPLRPIGQRIFGESLVALEEPVREQLGGGPVLERWQTLVAAHYRAGETVGGAFARFLAAVMGERAPLLLDAQLPALKAAQRPFLRRLIAERAAVDAAYAAAEDAFEARGYTLQVRKQRQASPLFLIHDGARRRIEWRGDEGYGLRGLGGFEGQVDELLTIAGSEPERLSPGVLARPAIQDAVLGTALQVMGPAELTYLGQARAIYDLLEVTAPATTLRPQAVVIERKQASWLAELEVPLGTLLEQSAEVLVASRLERDTLAPLRESTVAGLDGLRQAILDLDGSLETPWRKTREQVDRAFEQLQAKVAAAVARRHEVWLRRFEQMRQALLPFDHGQERELAIAYFVARHGPTFAAELLAALDLDARRLTVLEMGGL
jgi:bacillithiol biosynthesis cysteine-adding enzyme BshC